MLAPSIDALNEERYRLLRIGVGYGDWRLMPPWARQDTLLRHAKETKSRIDRMKQGWRQLLDVVLAKLLW